jgi:hypothetical protein
LLQDITRYLKRQFAPSNSSSLTTIRDAYKRVLADAAKGSVDPKR